jgi:hypothetical protein
MNGSGIDIAPYRVVYGSVGDDDTLPLDLADRVHARLREHRLVGAVDRSPRREGDGLTFQIVLDAAGRAVCLDETGVLTPGSRLDDVRTVLGDELRMQVQLVDDEFPEDDVAVADIAGDDVELSPTEAGLDVVDDALWPEPDSLIVLFSRRGPGWAGLVAREVGSVVEAGIHGGWSAFRFRGFPSGLATRASRSELPLVVVSLDEHQHPHAYVEVVTTAPRWWRRDDAPGGHILFPFSYFYADPVFEVDEGANDATRRVLRVLAEPALLAGSDVDGLVIDTALAVDAVALHRAVKPIQGDSAGPLPARIADIVTAIGVPSVLASAALGDDAMPGGRRYEPSGVHALLLDLVHDGVGALRPVDRSPGPLARLDQWTRRRPERMIAIAAAETAVAAALIIAAVRTDTRWRRAAGATGVTLAIDALLNGIVATLRFGRRRVRGRVGMRRRRGSFVAGSPTGERPPSGPSPWQILGSGR